MYKRILIGVGIAGILVVSGSVFARPAAALTVGEIQSQIKELLAKVAELTRQLNDLKSQSTTSEPPVSEPTSNSWRHRICAALYRNLAPGTSGDDVTSLQEFLSEEGYFTTNATGYFGPVTAQAVAKWQASQGVSSVGAVGPMTRERIKIWCGGGDGIPGQRFTATPQRGTAPLTVTFNTWISGFRMASDKYIIEFGDGTSEAATGCYAPTDFCQSAGQNTHTYASNGTYTALLVHTQDPCGNNTGCMAPVSREVAGKLQIQVGGTVSCTKEYKPVCGQKQVTCITAPCNPVQQTYSNRCEMEAAGARFLYEGQCKTVTTDPSADPQCKTWTDGCNSCSRSTPGGPGMCTLMACSPSMIALKAYCTSYFDSTSNKPPVISGFSGPTTLTVNQTGTWTIRANDPENQSLSYHVSWGDEYASVPTMSAGIRADAFVQTTTFTHAYSAAGTYTVSIIVRDTSGKEARTTTTVKVGGSVTQCTMEYNPVCGRKVLAGCTPGNCNLDTTYSNRCIMSADGATFLHEGACQTTATNCPVYSSCPAGYRNVTSVNSVGCTVLTCAQQ